MIIELYNNGEQLQIKTNEGLVFVTSSFDTKIFKQDNSSITVEDFARIIGGKDIEISYLTEDFARKLN